jgi:Mrp family chromosome partitioning ATPase/capsular polysaccharide biosynthesis protein
MLTRPGVVSWLRTIGSMMSQAREFTLRGYLEVIRRQRVVIAVVTIICTAAALGLSLVQKPSYTATSSLAVSDPDQGIDLVGSSAFSNQTPLQLSSAAAPQVTRPVVTAAVKLALRSPLSTTALQDKVAVSVDPNSYLLDIAASDRVPARAAAIANAFATIDATLTTAALRAQYKAQAANLKQQLRHLAPTSSQYQTTALTLSRLENLSAVATPLQVSAQATVPTSPSSPKTARNTVAALLFGLLLGIAIGTGRDVLDRRLRHAADVAQVLDHPVVGHIRAEALGHSGSGGKVGTSALGPLEEPDEEAFRILRQNVRYLAAAGDASILLVTSAMAEEGKSTVAACLAVATAEAGQRTLLVECDLRRPVLAARFGLNPGPGLTDYLTGNAGPGDILQPVAGLVDRGVGSFNGSTSSAVRQDSSNLVCITSGTTVPRPAELLASERFHNFVREVQQVYDSVILDTAPLLPVADTLGMIPDASALLVCVRLGHTTRDQARAAQSALSRLPERPVGLVLTDVRQNEDGYYYGYYGAPVGASV